MTILTIGLVLDDPENNSKMQRHRGKKKTPSHLQDNFTRNEPHDGQ